MWRNLSFCYFKLTLCSNKNQRYPWKTCLKHPQKCWRKACVALTKRQRISLQYPRNFRKTPGEMPSYIKETSEKHLSTGWFFETDIFNCFISQNVKVYERSNYMENSPDRFPYWYLVSQKFQNFLVITHLWRLLRHIIVRIWKIHWKLIIF